MITTRYKIGVNENMIFYFDNDVLRKMAKRIYLKKFITMTIKLKIKK